MDGFDDYFGTLSGDASYIGNDKHSGEPTNAKRRTVTKLQARDKRIQTPHLLWVIWA